MDNKQTKENTIATWLSQGTDILKKSGIESARLDCLLLLADELQKTKEWLLAHSDHEIGHSNLLGLNTKLVQRSERTPLAYIRTRQEFFGRSFYVDQSVLIPRPESESIITLLCKVQPCKVILDIGTGSGCLAITAKLELLNVRVIATDISKRALAVAKNNAKALNAEVEFNEADLFPTTAYPPSTTILANLPYVPDGLVTSKEIDYEPCRAFRRIQQKSRRSQKTKESRP